MGTGHSVNRVEIQINQVLKYKFYSHNGNMPRGQGTQSGENEKKPG